MYKVVLIVVSFFFLLGFQDSIAQEEKPRVIVMTDGEVDDRCSMIRFLLYTNDVDLLAIIQTNSVYQTNGWSSDTWIEQQIDAYEQVYSNLIVHDSDYPSAEELRSKLYVGDEDSTHLGVDFNSPNRVPGMEPAVDPENWTDTPGSDKIVEILLENDPRPVFIQAWGGGNTAARAFYKLKTQYPDDYYRAVSKAVVYNIWYQDGGGSYIEKFHPDVTMLLSHFFSGTWDYGSQRYTEKFVADYLHNNHGPLAKMYPQSYISEGDSPAFLYSIENGLRGYENPEYGGWAGRFYKAEGFQNVYRDVDKGSYLNWVEVANRDFETRLNWCVAENYGDANHKPVISVKGGLDKTVKSGEVVEIEATINDNDSLDVNGLWEQYSSVYEQQGMDIEQFAQMIKGRPTYSTLWWQFQEAGTYPEMIKIENPCTNKIKFTAPFVKEKSTIHIILEAKDTGIPNLTAFKRLIINVLP